MTLNILVVDDDSSVRGIICERVREMGHQCKDAENVTTALGMLDIERFDLILTDYKMDDFDGLYFIHEINNRKVDSLVVMMTAYASIDKAVAVIKEGAFDFVSKPFNSNQLRQMVQKVEKVLEAKNSNREPKSEATLEYFKGLYSAQMAKLEAFVRKVAPTDATVLLTGDSGTGKSQLAKELHLRSPVRSGPFIEVHCTTLPSELIESELFGHEKGSFTGATKSKKGKIQEAEKGSLFLDEIGELPAGGQAKLLRFIQEKQIDPVGSNKSYYVETRIIAATNKNLMEMVKQGKFREDLYYRLNMFECLISPLKERMEDVPVLMEKFIAGMQAKYQGEKVFELSPELKDKFLRYSWPGNVRELKNTIERLCYLSDDGVLREKDLPEKYFDGHLMASKSIEYLRHKEQANSEEKAQAPEVDGMSPECQRVDLKPLEANSVDLSKHFSHESQLVPVERESVPCNNGSMELGVEQDMEQRRGKPQAASQQTGESDRPLLSLEQVERNHIEHVLGRVDNLDKASEILGITTVTLWRKRKQYGIS